METNSNPFFLSVFKEVSIESKRNGNEFSTSNIVGGTMVSIESKRNGNCVHTRGWLKQSEVSIESKRNGNNCV